MAKFAKRVGLNLRKLTLTKQLKKMNTIEQQEYLKSCWPEDKKIITSILKELKQQLDIWKREKKKAQEKLLSAKAAWKAAMRNLDS